MITTILVFIIILSLLVFVHELGHFFTAKKLGIKVDEFGFGFPPRALGIVKENGKWRLVWGSKEKCEDKTVYSINWIPLGGFVKIHGESGDLKEDPRSFASRPPWQRFIVLFAGVFMNFVLAAFLLAIGFGVGLPTIVDEAVSDLANLSNAKIQVMSLLDGSPADLAGIEPGDEILSIDNQVFTSANEARDYIISHEGQEINFLNQRGEDALAFAVTASEIDSHEGKVVGVGLVKTATISYPWYLAAVKGVATAGLFTKEVVKAFGGLLWNLVVRQEVSADLSGPIGIAVMTGEAASLGIVYLLQFAAILSINLAVVNILPFPALDGGRIIFLAVEKIRGRAVHEKWETLVHNLGFIVLILLIAVVTVRDLFKFGG